MLETLDLQHVTSDILREIHGVKRPLLIFGAGIRCAVSQAEELRALLGIPLVVTWAARDVFPDADAFGTHGLRAANFAVQTADYIIAVGTRLDTKATGTPASGFAPLARLVMVDVDDAELAKMEKIGRPLYRAIRADAGEFLRMMTTWARGVQQHDGSFPDWQAWRAKIADWQARYQVMDPAYRAQATINPYVLVEQLSAAMAQDDVLVADTGCGLAWIMQAFRFRGQQFVHAFNQTPMGYGLPAAIGAAFAKGRRVVLVTGDGGLGECATELATVARHKLPIKILLLNNHGHAMCRQTQRQWLGGEYPSTTYDGGLATPNFVNVGDGYDIASWRIDSADHVDEAMDSFLSTPRAELLECAIPMDAEVAPQVRFGKGIEDADPALPDVAAILAEAL